MIVAIDTNILVYAAEASGDHQKHQRSASVIRGLATNGRGILPLQALTEFYAVAVRKDRVLSAGASAFVENLAEIMPVHAAAQADLIDAMRVHREHNIQFWDGLLWSVSRRAGARYLLSEDFQDGRELEGVRFVNPFAGSNAALIDQLTE